MQETTDIVIGANGFIGGHIYRQLKQRGGSIVGTSHDRRDCASNIVFLDLRNPDVSFLDAIETIGHVYCCARSGTIDQCKKDPTGTAQVNVVGMLTVLAALKKRGGVPVFFSGNMVFPGLRGDYNEDDTTDPVTEYGRQKLQIERVLTRDFDRYIILRLTKVYGVTRGDKSLFTSWLDSWDQKLTVRAVTDITIAPVYVGDMVETLRSLVEKNSYGIWHFPGTQSGTVFDFAQRLASYFRINGNLLVPATQDDFHWLESRPAYNTLSSIKIPIMTRKQFTIDRAFEQLRAQYPSFDKNSV